MGSKGRIPRLRGNTGVYVGAKEKAGIVLTSNP